MPARSASSTSRSREARSQAAGRGGQTAHARAPRGLRNRLPSSRVRWDRKLRVTMLLVLGLVGWVGAHAGMALLRTRAQANEEQALVAKLERQNRQLQQQAQSLDNAATIVRDARSLGMVRTGERAYVVTGLHGH